MALALVSKASPFGIAKYTADFIAKDSQTSRNKEMKEKSDSVKKANSHILKHELANKKMIFQARPQRINPKYAGIRR